MTISHNHRGSYSFSNIKMYNPPFQSAFTLDCKAESVRSPRGFWNSVMKIQLLLSFPLCLVSFRLIYQKSPSYIFLPLIKHSHHDLQFCFLCPCGIELFLLKNNAVAVTFGKKQESMCLFYLSSLTIYHCELREADSGETRRESLPPSVRPLNVYHL